MNRIATLSPTTRMNELVEKVQEIQTKEVGGPCGSFSFAYHFMCDYHNAPFVEEVAWVMRKRQLINNKTKRVSQEKMLSVDFKCCFIII